MLDSRLSLPLRFRMLNAAAKYLRAARLPVARLDEETLSRAAIRETGLSDFGDPYYREGLLALIESAEKDAHLHFLGRFALHDIAATYLSNRLLLAEASKRTPDVFERPLIPPIIVLGLPRTGTTFLHRMLTVDPAHRGVPVWQLLRPLPNGEPDRRRQLAERALKMQEGMTPGRDRMHYTRVDTPEECMVLQGTTFASVFFFASMPVYGYADWFYSYDQSKAYQEYLMLLQVLQDVEPERRLTLKAPAHTGALPVLHRLIPDALIIQTHRDPVAACNSASSLFYASYAMVTDRVDVPKMADTLIRALEKAAAVSLEFREANPGLIHDVHYDQLVADPVGTVKGIYEHFGLPWPDGHERRLNDYVLDNPQGRHGEHHYSSPDFGLTDDAIAKRFAEYSAAFGFA